MHTKKAKYHLKRIETILDLHTDGLTRLDRDILLEDIRRLYDVVCEAEISRQVTASSMTHDHTRVEAADDIVTKTEMDKETPEAAVFNKNDAPPIETPEPEDGTKSNHSEVEDARLSVSEDPESVDVEHVPATVAYESKTREKEHSSGGSLGTNGPKEGNGNPQPHSPSPNPESQEEYGDVMVEEADKHPELFNFESSSELSDRLANSKIERLNTILTINDKILYINHLFGGEAIPFQESLRKFEGFYTYEEAKKYASEELVGEYNWKDKEKKETVRQFMRQVKRLYS